MIRKIKLHRKNKSNIRRRKEQKQTAKKGNINVENKHEHSLNSIEHESTNILREEDRYSGRM